MRNFLSSSTDMLFNKKIFFLYLKTFAVRVPINEIRGLQFQEKYFRMNLVHFKTLLVEQESPKRFIVLSKLHFLNMTYVCTLFSTVDLCKNN